MQHDEADIDRLVENFGTFARAVTGTHLEIDVRGKLRPAVVKDKPLYRKGT